jgi:hypothetical protein
MGAQFDYVTYSPEVSLTLIVDDLTRHRQDAPFYPKAGPLDLLSWLNALHRQSAPLVQSQSSRENLEAWLDAVQEHFPSTEDAPAQLPAP